jgi:hypothetical protein
MSNNPITRLSDFENRLQCLVRAEAKDSLWFFFLAFSRFEYALKSAGFVVAGRYLRVDWKRFASEHKDHFNPDLNRQLRDACAYFKSKPPKNQVVRANRLDWDNSPPCGDKPLLCWLIDMVCRVRNNLFHGGKFQSGRIEDPARDPALLRHSLTILEACLAINPEVKQKFMQVPDATEISHRP